jgi:hypothetical protein
VSWLWENTLLSALLAAAVVLLVLWPTRQSGRRLLRRWGVAEPEPPQIATAVQYLLRRRILFAVLWIGLALAATAVPALDEYASPGGVIVPLLAAMLLAELIAMLRPARGVRVASLDRRTWRDVLPVWTVVVGAVLVGWIGALTVVGLAAASAESSGVNWYPLGGTLVCLTVVGTVVFLAVRRPSVADAAVDAALRVRTARVATGMAYLWLAGLAYDSVHRLAFADGPFAGSVHHVQLEFAGFTVALGALWCWATIAVPNRVSPARAG